MSIFSLSESESWRITAWVLLAISSAIFVIQRFVASFLDPIFEFCIFHLPTLIAVLIYYRKQRASLS